MTAATAATATPTTRVPRPLVLVILDGFGERAEADANAIRMAHTPALAALYARYPHGLIGTSGPDVGLPPGQMGNSEVGHLNFGAGRIALMDIARIDTEVATGALAKNAVITGLLDTAVASGGRLHLFGLVSDGGVHSSLEHLLAIIDTAHARGVPVVVHAFLDGRDVQPGTAPGYVQRLEQHLGAGTSTHGTKGIIGTVAGRYWAMDRDNRWERVERAYKAIVHADAPRFPGPDGALQGIRASYDAKKTDEFVEPFVVGAYDGVHAGDVGLHFNFRPDRARELTRALATTGFAGFPRAAEPPFPPSAPAGPAAAVGAAHYACMTTYDLSLGLPIAYPKETFSDIFPEVIARAGKTQFRCAETEKYAHVTYFFNGGREEPFTGEDRTMVPSPKEVATYDQKPEMSAKGVTDAVVAAIESGKYDFILVNYANPDMVGHTGILDAAIHAVETVDQGLARLADAVRARGGAMFITADHGNCELMKDPATGQPHTAHTLNPVPLIYVNDADVDAKILPGGRICDVAPTMLALLGLPQPAVMTGHTLLVR